MRGDSAVSPSDEVEVTNPVVYREEAVKLFMETLSIHIVPQSGIINLSYYALTPQMAQDILNNEKAISTISRIQSQISANQISSTNILEISVTSEDPGEAQCLANTITETFRQENLGLNNRRIIEAKVLIEDLLGKQNHRLIETEENLKEFRRGNGIFNGYNQTAVHISEEYKNVEKKLEEKAHFISGISKIIEKHAVVFTDKEINKKNLQGTPIIGKKELKKIHDPEDVFTLILERITTE